MFERKLIIGTRGSTLALIQTNLVADAIRANQPGIEIEIKTITTKGDVNQAPIPLDTIGKNWFTKEIEEALLNKEIDIAVHSLKDVAPEIPEGLLVFPVLEREDPREVLVSKTGAKLLDLPKGAIIGTDSLRRKAQLLHARADFDVRSIRGNVDSRLRKLQEENYDAIVIAAAGLKRLDKIEVVTEFLDPAIFIPAPGQGVLAAQIRSGDADICRIVEHIQNDETSLMVEAESAFTRVIGGGCKLPIACLAAIHADKILMLAMLAQTDGSNVEYANIEGPTSIATKLAEELAKKLLDVHA